MEFARSQGYDVPREWIFEDDGFSGASLVRPGLERLRDLAAEGQLEAVLVHAPDRLSRKYAYQILLIEEFARNGVETVFMKAPKSDTPEDQLRRVGENRANHFRRSLSVSAVSSFVPV